MKRIRAVLVVAALGIIAGGGCAVTQKSLTEKGLKPQTQQELAARYARPVKVRFVNDQNQTGIAEYTPEGAARLTLASGNVAGKWRVVDGKFCTQYPQLRGGAEACFMSYRTGPKEYMSFHPDGSYNATATDID